MLRKTSSSPLCQRLMMMRARSGSIPKPFNATRRRSKVHNAGTFASPTISIMRAMRRIGLHSDENCDPMSSSTMSKRFCATFTTRSSGATGIVCHSSGCRAPPNISSFVLCCVISPAKKWLSRRSKLSTASRTVNRGWRSSSKCTFPSGRAKSSKATCFRANVASCTPRVTPTVVAPTPPFDPITTINLSSDGRSFDSAESCANRASISFSASGLAGFGRKSCTPLRIASSISWCPGGTMADTATSFIEGRMRRNCAPNVKYASGSRDRSRKTTSGNASAESGKRSEGIVHCLIDFTMPVCCRAATSCAELVVSPLAIATLSMKRFPWSPESFSASSLALPGSRSLRRLRRARRLLRRAQKRLRHVRRWRCHIRWMHNARRHHNQQFVLALRQRPALKKLPQNRHVADPGNFVELIRHTVIEQACDGKALPIPQLHVGLHPRGGQCRNQEALDRQRVREIQRTHLRLHLQMNQPVGRQGRRKVQSHSEFLELDGDSREASACGSLQNWKGKFAARQETRLFPRLRHQIRFRENLQHVVLFQRLDGGCKINVRPEDEEIEQIAQTNIGTGSARAARRRADQLRRRKLLRRDRADILSSRQAQNIDAQLRFQRPVHVRELNFEQNFTRRGRRNLHQTGHFRRSGLHHFQNFVGHRSGRYAPRKNHDVARSLHLYRLRRKHFVDLLAQAQNVNVHRNFKRLALIRFIPQQQRNSARCFPVE